MSGTRPDRIDPSSTTKPVVVTGIFGNEGETEGSLSICAVVTVNPFYSKDGRIIVGSPVDSDVNLGQMNMSPDKAIEMATHLVEAANAAVAACPTSCANGNGYPVTIHHGFMGGAK